MKKTILSLAAAAALVAGGVIAAPQQANAVAWWVAPAIVGGALVGVGVGATAANANAYAYAYEPRGAVYVQPTARCHIERQPINGVWQRVRVCD